jgi:hypothetical protein
MERVICSRCALRRPSVALATFPTAKLPSIVLNYNLGEILLKSTLTSNHHPLHLFILKIPSPPSLGPGDVPQEVVYR